MLPCSRRSRRDIWKYLRWDGEDEEATTHCAGSYRLLKKKSAQRKEQKNGKKGMFALLAEQG